MSLVVSHKREVKRFHTQLSVISYQLSVSIQQKNNHQLSVNPQLSTVNCHLLTVNC
ncbi:MAG: hypothetical protein ACRC62_29145 [Microcoleus sp.]